VCVVCVLARKPLDGAPGVAHTECTCSPLDMPPGLGRGYSFVPSQVIEPNTKRVVAFVDGQNLFHAARQAFGYTVPNYDVAALAGAVTGLEQGWSLARVHFYTGVPDPSNNAHWHAFWSAKLALMGRQGIRVFSRPLRYRTRIARLRDGTAFRFLTGEEKGIDVRLALDVIRFAHRAEYDVALVFSQDQDLSEVAEEIRVIAREQDRWIKVTCAFPSSPTSVNRRGINSTDWIRIDRRLYDRCIDPHDYRRVP
jgi:uncharacterized LabA/DUF88 family protein